MMALQKLTSNYGYFLVQVQGGYSSSPPSGKRRLQTTNQSEQVAAESGPINEDAKMASLKLKTSAFIGEPKM